ncbi:MAG: tyrosine--tRNA ligase [Gemmatimonadetes bacterium]|nr:tyrosine--tRNA ligase [Gemmatimonadota bacterium]MYK53697.1 tyrosine--tRNA ligase [Gemmatimonadota bacterium]
MDVLDDLAFRGYIFQMTDEDKLRRRLAEGQMTLYCGFDPTADSLHAGSLVPIMGLRRFQDAGHKPIALVGGGTGLIGDPSGKAEERQLNSLEVVQAYTESQRAQLEKYLDFEAGHNPALMVSNYTWLSELRTIEFLRDVGKHFSMGYMLGKESVSSRLSTGISFTEFSYMVLQAYDFMALNREYGCELQIGGSDQWGNITAGIELCRRVLNKTVYGLTFPLLEKSDGTKFGKTETGTLWLDPEKTSPYQFYQFWVNVADRDVVKFLKLFTFLSRERIEELEREVEARPEKREAQRVLAEEVTTFIHGAAAKDRAVHISEALFYGNLRDLNEQEIAEGFSDVLSYTLKGVDEVVLIDLLVDARISSSRRQAREDIRTGAIYINGERCTDMSHVLKPSERLAGKYLVIRRGKRSYFLVSWPA